MPDGRISLADERAMTKKIKDLAARLKKGMPEDFRQELVHLTKEEHDMIIKALACHATVLELDIKQRRVKEKSE